MYLPTPTTNQMVFSAHLKTKIPRRVSMRVIIVKAKTKTMPRALSGSFYLIYNKIKSYKLFDRGKIVGLHDCGWFWHTLQVDLTR